MADTHVLHINMTFVHIEHVLKSFLGVNVSRCLPYFHDIISI